MKARSAAALLSGLLLSGAAAPAPHQAREQAYRENNHAIEAIVPMGDALGGGPSGKPHEQLAANQMVATVDDPALGTTTQVGVPIHLKGTPGAIKGPRPEPGQHNEEIFGALGYTPEAMKAFT